MPISVLTLLTVTVSFTVSYVQAQNNGDIRLVGGSNNLQGSVEIFMDESWGTVCVGNSSLASIRAVADTACRQLRFKSAYAFGTVKGLGYTTAPPSTPIHIGSITCPYADSVCSKDYPLHLLHCTVDQNVDHATCTHDDDVAVYCYPESISSSPYDGQVALYLTEGNKHPVNVSLSSGIVGIFFNNSSKPGVMCGNGLDQNVADTACRQLGYTNARSFNASIHTNKVTVWDTGLNCKSHSHSCLRSCFSKKPNNQTGCDSVIAVSCEFNLSLKNTNPPGSPLQCDAKHCNSQPNNNEQGSSPIAIVIAVVVIVVIAAACTLCITLLLCCLVPGCVLYRKRSGYQPVSS